MLIEFLQKNIMLVGIALVSGGMLIWPALRRTTGGPWANTLEATQMINREDALVLDVRDATDYSKGHLLGARHIAHDQLERRIVEVAKNKNRPIIVYDDGGRTAGRALEMLQKLGYSRAYNLTGGYAGWKQAGLPVEK